MVLEDLVRRWSDSPNQKWRLAVAYAGLGRRDEALREAKLAVELAPPSTDALGGSAGVIYFARVYVMVGDHDLAVEQLESLASIAPWYSAAYLQIDPAWEPLRDHPRFQTLLAREQ